MDVRESLAVRPSVADPDLLRACVHCGLCLNACPTYLELGTEMDSPRGRIHLLSGLAEGTLRLDGDVVRHLDLCLGCRACEPACPSGVRYGAIIEGGRAFLEQVVRRPWRDRLRRAGIRALLPHPSRLAVLLGAARVVRAFGLWPLIERFVDTASLLPPDWSGWPLAEFHPALGKERARVGLLTGCVGTAMFADINAAAVRVLTRAGAAVVVPRGQGCCGALHLHGGHPGEARALARHNMRVFPADLDAVVATAAGCGAALREYDKLFTGGPDLERATEFAGRVFDVSEFIAALGAPPPRRRLPLRVTYHDACHLAHVQGVREAPRRLLAAIPGIELVELSEADVCCGSAGSYNLTEPEMARRLRERKVDRIAATGAACVVAANPGCALQIRAGLAARGLDVRVAHTVELLDEASA